MVEADSDDVAEEKAIEKALNHDWESFEITDSEVEEIEE